MSVNYDIQTVLHEIDNLSKKVGVTFDGYDVEDPSVASTIGRQLEGMALMGKIQQSDAREFYHLEGKLRAAKTRAGIQTLPANDKLQQGSHPLSSLRWGKQAISEILSNSIEEGQLARLRAAGYMSPQSPEFRGQGFACQNCDHFKQFQLIPTAREIKRRAGLCENPTIKSPVEAAGCCNKFTFDGVST